MSPADRDRIRDAGQCADQIACICSVLGEMLMSDPATVTAGSAAEGVFRLARRLANDLSAMADPEPPIGDAA